MFKSYTIKDIAKALGLSTSTVSRALNGSYEIGAETKKLVLEYAEKVNYRPNPIALSLKEQRSRSIGVVVCEVANNYFSQAINGIESIAYSSGYHVIITQTHESAAREAANVQHLLSRHVDGLLIALSAETTDTSEFKFLHSKGVPIVFFDRIAEGIDTHRITVNNFKAAFEATEQLIIAGFSKIANISSTPNLLNTRERFEGYRAALQKHGLTLLPEFVKYCYQGGMVVGEVEHALQELMSLPEKPDAIIATNDRITTTCLPILKKMGFSIPSDVALTGFTNSEVAESFAPPLTVVRQPAFMMGQLATETLIKAIESKHPLYESISQQFDTQLIIRDSSLKS
ncbi:LacI family DNA-binding transcriptional regulator [Mucilaginibacter terrae]|uniref:LacI family transcriptional regulator n=1 Tax=Mucilaginibacter terrae TaxID=1955052 RepID=A0ABU3GSE7_9SPHI|nr:LacI family DNA-binding transcriptional regulator [Mucilaginibacter terrae]MDT3401902.1 LacI family transcriptional regulator [Mucilaginibacter terrae]